MSYMAVELPVCVIFFCKRSTTRIVYCSMLFHQQVFHVEISSAVLAYLLFVHLSHQQVFPVEIFSAILISLFFLCICFRRNLLLSIIYIIIIGSLFSYSSIFCSLEFRHLFVFCKLLAVFFCFVSVSGG